MAQQNADIAIIGAGIAGLWAFNRFKREGYDCVLLESNAIGGGQSIASQGIIHSGFKYKLDGKNNALSQSISAMPDLWRDALKGRGPVDLSAASVNSSSQHVLIARSFLGGIISFAARKILGAAAKELPERHWPSAFKGSGFKGSVIDVAEPVLDIPSVIRALAEPYRNCIRLVKPSDDVRSLVKARLYIYTSAAGNLDAARRNNDAQNIQTQTRPLLMGMMRNAPFDLYAHLVGATDKPLVTVTTHRAQDGSRIWYFGGMAAERPKESDPEEVFQYARDAISRYMPKLNLHGAEWAALPIDRVEWKPGTQGWMPDRPVIHAARDSLYCWPTKLTFAPLLSDMIADRLKGMKIEPLNRESDFSFLPEADYAQTPWDKATWKKERSARRA